MCNSIYDLLNYNLKNKKNQLAAKFKKYGFWNNLTWEEFCKKVYQIASKLLELKIEHGDRIVLLSNTKIEWVLLDLAILIIGAITVPVYHSSTASDIYFIYKNSKAKFIIIEDLRQFEKLLDVRFLMFDEIYTEHLNLNMYEIERRGSFLKRTDLASIIYTSGTTGKPKGACLTHDNFLYEAQAIEKLHLITNNDIQLIFLPLAHVFARAMEMAWLKTGHVLCFAESADKLIYNMKINKPTFVAGIPRIYEKIYTQTLKQICKTKGIFKILLKIMARKQAGFFWTLTRKFFFKKIKKELNSKLGGYLKFFISGGAPLNFEIAQFFLNIKISILEGYGLTETTAASCVNLLQSNHIGTVGRPLPETKLKIAKDGEILIKSRGVFLKYWRNKKQTLKVFTGDGWLRTGDIGHFDTNGFLKITDRKKDLIVTSGGKKIAPQKLENMIKSKITLISQVIVCGDRRNYLVALLILDKSKLKDFAINRNISENLKELAQNRFVIQEIKFMLDDLNQNLASFEQIKKFKILNDEFKIGEQLTPTLKVKRAFLYRKYSSEIRALYME